MPLGKSTERRGALFETPNTQGCRCYSVSPSGPHHHSSAPVGSATSTAAERRRVPKEIRLANRHSISRESGTVRGRREWEGEAGRHAEMEMDSALGACWCCRSANNICHPRLHSCADEGGEINPKDAIIVKGNCLREIAPRRAAVEQGRGLGLTEGLTEGPSRE